MFGPNFQLFSAGGEAVPGAPLKQWYVGPANGITELVDKHTRQEHPIESEDRYHCLGGNAFEFIHTIGNEGLNIKANQKIKSPHKSRGVFLVG